MPTLIEKVLFSNPPKYSEDQMHFAPTELAVEGLGIKMYLDVVTPTAKDGQTLSSYVIIYAHSNQETINANHSWMRSWASSLRCRFVAFDYLGYGNNAGSPTEENTKCISDAVLNYVHTQWPESHIIVWGKSVGCFCACYLASRSHDLIHAIILECGFASALSTLRNGGRGCLLNDQFMNKALICEIECPILLVHGD